jgi:hypothetical protein
MSETETCKGCGATTQLEEDVHDGGSVWCLPGEWGYRETRAALKSGFPLAYCPTCQPAACNEEYELLGLPPPYPKA